MVHPFSRETVRDSARLGAHGGQLYIRHQGTARKPKASKVWAQQRSRPSENAQDPDILFHGGLNDAQSITRFTSNTMYRPARTAMDSVELPLQFRSRRIVGGG